MPVRMVDVGHANLRITKVLDFRPDQGFGFIDLAPTLLINEAVTLKPPAWYSLAAGWDIACYLQVQRDDIGNVQDGRLKNS